MTLDILHLHRESVYPPSDGGEVRAWKTADRLSRSGTVWFAQPCANAHVYENGVRTVDVGNPYLRTKATRIYLWNAMLGLDAAGRFDRHQTDLTVETLVQHPASFDLVVCESPQTIRASRELADHFDAKLLVDFHNAMYELLDQQLRSRPIPGVLRRRAVAHLRRLEHAALEAADAAVFQSPDDVDAYDVPSDTVVEVIPNGCDYEWIAEGGDPDAVETRLGLDGGTVCVYVGAYDYEPNREAADAICEEIAPAMPAVTFVLAGRNPPASTPPNVETPGFVDDLPGLLSRADVALCPLTTGSGTKLKVMDYLAAGLPIVTTEVGTQGIEIEDGVHALVRDEPAAFPEAIRRLKRTPALRGSLGEHAATLGEQYAWDGLLEGYDDLLATLFDAEHQRATAEPA